MAEGQVEAKEWEKKFQDGMLIPLYGWWFRVQGVVREAGKFGSLVLEATGDRTTRGTVKAAK